MNSHHNDVHSEEESFAEKRDKLRRFIEANVSPVSVKIERSKKPPAPDLKVAPIEKQSQHLAAAIKEFYAVQRKFHADMEMLTQRLDEIMQHLPPEDKLTFADLLAPYQALASNPFSGEPTGDVDSDVAHILTVMKAENAEFKTALSAFLDSASNLEDLKKQLQRLKNDTKLAALVKEKVGSWMRLEGGVDQPFQHLIRYELLLKAIQKELVSAGYVPTEEASEFILESLEQIVPEVRNINHSKEAVTQLNRIDRILLDLASKEAEQQLHSGSDEECRKEKILFIESLHFIIINQKNSIAKEGGGNSLDFFKALLELLRQLDSRYETKKNEGLLYDYVNYASAGAYSMLSAAASLTLFGQATRDEQKQDPLVALRAEISKMSEELPQADLIRELYERCPKVKWS